MTPLTPPQKMPPGAGFQSVEAFAQAVGESLPPELALLLTEAIAAQARRQQNAIKGLLE